MSEKSRFPSQLGDMDSLPSNKSFEKALGEPELDLLPTLLQIDRILFRSEPGTKTSGPTLVGEKAQFRVEKEHMRRSRQRRARLYRCFYDAASP